MTFFPDRAARGARFPMSVLLGLLVPLPVMALVAAPATTLATMGFVAGNLLALAPALLVAIGSAAALRATGADELAATAFRGRQGRMIVAATALGAVTPVCGLGAVPLITGLLRAGVPLAPVMAFWLASPVTDPAMLALTAGTLGLAFAAAKTLAALAIGLLGGLATRAVQDRPAFARPLRPSLAATGSIGTGRCCGIGPVGLRWSFWREPARCRLFVAEAWATTRLVLPWMSLALAVESLMQAWLPAEAVAPVLGTGSAVAIPLAVLVGTPLYVDGYAALPLVRGLLDLGMSPGAALAFLVSGGITSLYAALAVLALVRVPVFLLYLGLAMGGSLAAGYAFAFAQGSWR